MAREHSMPPGVLGRQSPMSDTLNSMFGNPFDLVSQPASRQHIGTDMDRYSSCRGQTWAISFCKGVLRLKDDQSLELPKTGCQGWTTGEHDSSLGPSWSNDPQYGCFLAARFRQWSWLGRRSCILVDDALGTLFL